MKAVVYYGPGDIRICERPAPEAQADNLIIEVIYCAICGSDVKMLSVGDPRSRPPRIVGHELVGRVVHVGERVRGYAVGERITVAPTLFCGVCEYCKIGLMNVCPNNTPISRVYDGAFAPKMAVPPLALAGGSVVKVPEEVLDEEAALCEPLSCAINAQDLVGLKRGDNVLIIGGGPLGALHAELAKAAGARKVMITQRSEPRLSMLRKIKDVLVIDGKGDVEEKVLDETGGLGADVVIVCAPNREAQEGSLRFARKGGAVSLFASLPKGASDITVDSRLIHYGELRVVGASDSRPDQVQRAVELFAARKLDASPIITHRIPLERFHEGLELMRRKECLKVLVSPGAAD